MKSGALAFLVNHLCRNADSIADKLNITSRRHEKKDRESERQTGGDSRDMKAVSLSTPGSLITNGNLFSERNPSQPFPRNQHEPSGHLGNITHTHKKAHSIIKSKGCTKNDRQSYKGTECK